MTTAQIEEQEERERALRSARTIAAVALTTSLLALFGWWYRGNVTLAQWAVSAACALAVVLATFFAPRPRVLASSLAAVACIAAALTAAMISIGQVYAAGIRSEPYESFKLAALVIAMTALRPRALGYVAITLCGLVPIALNLTLFAEYRSQNPVQEPIATAMFAVVSLWIYRFRIRGTELEWSMARSRAHEEGLVRSARAVLALRDLYNTPIQTLTATTALLTNESTPRAEIARLNENALRRLSELSRMLSNYEGQIDWSRFEGSFDAEAVLKDILRP